MFNRITRAHVHTQHYTYQLIIMHACTHSLTHSLTRTHTHHGTLQLCCSDAVSLTVQHVIHPPSDAVVILLISQCTISSEVVACEKK